ncbi:adenomatous polyposis coli homolog isoform X2 [Melanaphis sacchari]|uniref:adenomatous polyposis coli homolog isoform X2 n=1 Tax=Melanaphis sacchari TaxID=742174 RepID=UPI000DC14FF0|nr:adenomatous polyposis coli homolog isoform X2 [Melanaphis sacchari]XP_025202078.1 adenomatous polyposis coli homolog isoform X2 [Melanaphis sacchari]
MTLPVSSYEELLETVRSLNQETRQLQRQLDTPLLAQQLPAVDLNGGMPSKDMSPIMSLSLENKTTSEQNQRTDKEKRSMAEDKEEDEAKISPDGCLPTPPGILADKKFNMWHSVGPTNMSSDSSLLQSQTSTLECEKGLSMRSSSQQQLGAKVEIVYNLLSLLENNNSIQSSYQSVSVLLAMSKSPDCCAAMRQTGCVPLLVQIVHDMNADIVVRHNASQALKNIVTFNQDEKQGRRESRVYKLLESMREYCDTPVVVLKQLDISKHPITAIAALMKLSFDSQHRFAMCLLGAIYTVTRLIQVDHEVHGSEPNLESNSECVTLRRYAGMALTNLTFGDATTKTLLCSFKQFLKVLILQLQIQCEDLRQVTASVLRNLSWRADPHSKEILRDVGAVKALMEASMKANKETTMKSFLSALWNFSAHSPENKEEICKVEGAIEFLIKTLSGTNPLKSVTIIENAGGILRNISCVIASHEEYRDILRHHNVLEMLMQQLQSPSLTIVSNACGTIWNLSARNIRDQTTMINLGIIPMLRSLIHSKHKMIATGSSAALNNLMNAMPAYNSEQDLNVDHEDNSIKNTLANSNTYLKDFAKEMQSATVSDDLKATEEPNLTKISQQSYDIIKINKNSLTTAVESEKLELSSIECSEDSIQQSESKISFEEKVKKSSNEYAETSLDEATNYSLLCEDDDNGEKVLTGDTTQTYCTEGTPYNFSNAASYTDLRKCGIDDKNRNESGIELPEQSMNVPNSGSETPDGAQPKNELKDGKMVTFETPLMFSRSSSIASLGSCEPQEGYIGSSAVSECSRVTSGLVTPSEIPDSPTPTVPPSPPCFKNESVFEDSVTIFKEEKMPGKGSECTSLSSLTIDDDLPEIKLQYIQGQNMLPSLNEEKISMNVLRSKQYKSPSIDKMSKTLQLNSDGFIESSSSEFPYLQNKNPGFIPHARSRLPVMVQSNSQTVDRCSESSFSQYKTNENEGDEIIGFCTEGTPANISSATSHSDLSMITPSEDGSETNVILRQSMKMVGKKRLYQTTGKPLGNLNLQFNQASAIPTSVNISLSRSLILDSPSTESHVSNSINSSEIEDPVTVINKRMSTDSIDSEFSLDDSSKCDNRIPHSHSLHDAQTLNSEPMSEDDDDDDDNNALLDQCINAGIEKITTLKLTDEELSDEQQEMLNQCIATGINISAIPKFKKRTKKQDGDLTDEQQLELLESCISAGIRNSKKPFKNNSDDLSDSEQVALLNECIEAGMTNLQNNRSKDTNGILEQNEEELLNKCINQGIKNIERGSTHKKREIPVLNKYKKSFGSKSESEISESTSTITPRDINDGITYKQDESDESTWKDDETLTFTTLTSSYLSAEEGSKPKFIKLDKGEMGIISSLDFEDTRLDAIKPPSDMDSLLSMTTSVQSNCGFDKKRKTSNDKNDSLGSCVNLENINPPSYMDEITDFEMENSITSISSIRSEIVDQSIGAQYYTAVDDLTLVDDLPSSEMSSDPNHSSPAQIRRRLTPKQKRNIKKDRYNTYTIISDDSRENSIEPETRSSPLNESDSHSSEDAIKKRSPKEKFQIKRSSEKDRFRTRTLADLDLTNIVQIQPKDNDFTSNFKNRVDESTTSEGTDGYSSDGNESNTGVPSARIVKPSEVKAVRGKKKSRGSGIPIVARSSPQPSPTTSKSSQSTPTKKQTPLKRQGTFVKEESRIPTPGSTGKKHTSVPNLVKPPANKQSTTSMRSSGVRNSVSNNSLKSSADQWAGSNSSLPTLTGVAKTNSNTSLNSNISATSSGCSVRTTSGQKKEVTSKIATLWKKIEDNKKKGGNAKDNRVWISSSPNNRI